MLKTKKRYQNELKKIIKALKPYKPEKIILFGSMLNPNQQSNDIDLLIVKETKVSRLGDRANEARKYLPDRGIPVDFLVFTPQEIKHELERENVFIAEVFKKGQLLYG